MIHLMFGVLFFVSAASAIFGVVSFTYRLRQQVRRGAWDQGNNLA